MPQRSDEPGRQYLELGLVARPHGVHGAVKVHLHNPASTALERCATVVLATGEGERHVAVQRTLRAGEQVVLELDGVVGRDAAEALRGARVLVERAVLEPLADGEYLCADLVGCEVRHEAGGVLGTVREVFSAGGSNVLVAVADDGERMIPFVDDWVLSVDLEARLIVVTGEWEAQ